jgi:hypothetical protein
VTTRVTRINIQGKNVQGTLSIDFNPKRPGHNQYAGEFVVWAVAQFQRDGESEIGVSWDQCI